MKNKIKECYEQGICSVGTMSHLKSTAAVEAIGAAGLDYIFIDSEHASNTADQLTDQIIAANAAGITPIVRVCSISRDEILHALDAGACGIVIPGIENIEQARQCVSYAKYTPVGKRGYCMTRIGNWGYGEEYAGGMEGYMKEANASTLLFLQCETVECLEDLENIADLEGVDGIMLGPYDLSIDMGIPGEFDDPRIRNAVQKVLDICRNKGKISMVFSGSAENAKKMKAAGFDSVIAGLDILQLITGYQQIVSDMRS
ncbi:MAG: aldolase/citrate lyase family protein [Lachnospiraceae bacterium]|nr:aldolase/citrate lyase family protein [Lachnospiraceae bacterium]